MTPTFIKSPADWRPKDITARTDWIHHLVPEEVAEMEAALASVKKKGIGFAELKKEDFPLERFPKLVGKVQDYLENGPGLFMIRGLPVERHPTQDLRMLYWGLGKHLGTAVSQSAQGDHIGDVRDLNIPDDSPSKRGYQSRGGGLFHCDTCDVAALFVLRIAKAGGVSMVASCVAIHNEIARTRPDLLEVLYQPLYWSMLQQEREGEPRFYPQPIFSMHEGYLSCRYIRPHIKQAQRFPEVPRLTERQIEAMDYFDSLVTSPEYKFDTNFKPGDLQFCNNHVVMHARTGFEDWPEPNRKRHLLRLWLSMPNTRPLSPLMGHIYRDRRPGAVRGGFPAKIPGTVTFETAGGETEVT